MKRATDPEAWHRPIRLPEENYRGSRWYFVTLCTHERSEYFCDRPTAEWLLRLLRDESRQNCFAVRAFCLMPDHLHLLLQGASLNADLLQFIGTFKKKSTHRFWLRNRKDLWQESFYDHILRDEDTPANVAWYIWLNPIRAGLTKKPEDYPFAGPFMKGWNAGQSPKGTWTPPKRAKAVDRHAIEEAGMKASATGKK